MSAMASGGKLGRFAFAVGDRKASDRGEEWLVRDHDPSNVQASANGCLGSNPVARLRTKERLLSVCSAADAAVQAYMARTPPSTWISEPVM